MRFQNSFKAVNSSVTATADIHIMACTGNWVSKAWCKIKEPLIYLKSILTKNVMNTLWERILYVNVPTVKVKFDVLSSSKLVVLKPIRGTAPPQYKMPNKIEKAFQQFGMNLSRAGMNRIGSFHRFVEAALSHLGYLGINQEIKKAQEHFHKGSCTIPTRNHNQVAHAAK
jgi:hypothetical protein